MRKLVVGWVLGSVLVAAGSVAMAGGGSAKDAISSRTTEPEQALTPEQQAIEHYNSGISHRDRAWRLEKKLEAAADKARAKLEKKLRNSYRAAKAEFERAIRYVPTMYEAHSDLGYCLRKLGDYEASLEAYGRALDIQPGYAEAIEYRAEAYLGLNRIEDAKAAYIQLFGNAREQADKLLEAMGRFVEDDDAAKNLAPAEFEAFARWVNERREIAGQTRPVSQLRKHDW